MIKTSGLQQLVCWVPTCVSDCDKKKYYSLASVRASLKETWLALALKPIEGHSEEQILFCEDHFQGADGEELKINNLSYGLDHGLSVPNKNMPVRICRTCNEIMDNKEHIYTMSTCFSSEIPKTVEVELQSEILVNPKPLYEVFRYCFSEFVVSPDPTPIICAKCHDLIWLFFAYKMRATMVEETLAQEMTAEEYGQIVLCRTCSVERSLSFFPLGKDTELGLLLQNIFSDRYSPDVVRLRVCQNCYNILNKINSFHKQCLNTEKIIRRRALLNAKLKTNSFTSKVASPVADPAITKESSLKKVEKENLILADLMLKYGQRLKNNLHNNDFWAPICQKLEEKGINYNVPSLINTWKKLQSVTFGKVQNQKSLSRLEAIVYKFETTQNNKAASPSIQENYPRNMQNSLLGMPNRSNTMQLDDFNRTALASAAEIPSRSVIQWNTTSSRNVTTETDSPLRKFRQSTESGDAQGSAKDITYSVEMQKLFLLVLNEEYIELLKSQSQGTLNLRYKTPWNIILERIALRSKLATKVIEEAVKLLTFMKLKADEAVLKHNSNNPIHQEILKLHQDVEKLASNSSINNPYSNNPVRQETLRSYKDVPKVHTQSSTNNAPNTEPNCPDTSGAHNNGSKCSTPNTNIIEENNTPLSVSEKFDLIEAVTQYRTKYGLLGQDPTVFSDIWPEIIQILREKGNTRDLEFVKKSWYQMIESATVALRENKMLDRIDTLLAGFLPQKDQFKTVDKISPAVVEQKHKRHHIPSMKKRGRPKKSDIEARMIQSDKGKTILPLGSKKNEVAVGKDPTKPKCRPTFDEEMALVKAMRDEYNKLTLEERKERKSHIPILLKRVTENRINNWGFERSLTVWRRLKRSASIHEKNSTDVMDNAVWAFLQQIQDDMSSPVKSPTNNSDGKIRNQDASHSPTKQTNSPVKNSETHKRSIDAVHDNTNSNISDGSPPTRKKLTVPPLKLKKVAFSNPDNQTETTADVPNSNRIFPHFDPTKLLKRKVFMHVKDTYKLMKRSGELQKTAHIWVAIFKKMDEIGYNGVDKEEMMRVWNNLRYQVSRALTKKDTISDFLREVNMFLRKVQKDKAAIYAGQTKETKKTGETTSSKMSLDPWTYEEKLHFLSCLEQHLDLYPSALFWVKVGNDYKRKGYTRSYQKLHPYIYTMMNRAENKFKKNIALDDIDKRVVEIIMKKKGLVRIGSNSKLMEIAATLKIPIDSNSTTGIDSKSNQLTPNSKTGIDSNQKQVASNSKSSPNSISKDVNVTNSKTGIDSNQEPVASNSKSSPSSISKDVNVVTPIVAKPSTTSNEPDSTAINSIAKAKSSIKTEIIPSETVHSSQPIDMAYDYVSLEDLQQSSAWEMPNLQPMVDEQPTSNVVAKVECDSEDGTNSGDDDSQDLDVNHSYVGARDLIGVINLIDSDEE